ncbi:MAG: response regulator transcription factor [Saprospiraceae bacterium]|nr:response regulator transcription factor [Saprospiraceae bacterium]MCB9326782.1 response regulator transcription factor [Lewinellaceae bacterium]
MITILIADDHKVFREGIISILNEVEDITIIAEAGDGREVMERLKEVRPQIILMDISMGDTSGIETTRQVREAYPEIKVLVLSMHSESAYIVKMLQIGASGYLLKDTGKEEMIRAIRTVAEGDTYYSQKVSSAIVEHLSAPGKAKKEKGGIPLTKREVEILRLIAEEYSNPEIAEKLFISIRTVDTHRRNLLEKLGIKNTAGLVKYAIKHGIAE